MELLPSTRWPAALRKATKTLESWGSVVEFRIFAVDESSGETSCERTTHQRAALLALESVLDEINARTIDPTTFTLNAEKLAVEAAVCWSPHEFFGPIFHIETRHLLLRGEFANGYFEPPYMERADLMLPRPKSNFVGYDDCAAQGFAQSVFEPPYGLRASGLSLKPLSNHEKNVVFLSLCDEMFGDLTALRVWSWPVSASNYFEAGLEWWGSYFWTVYAPQKRWIVAVLASTTD